MFTLNEESTIENKKVLLRERKRHTACHLASARYADLSPDGGGGGGGTPSSLMGYPQTGPGMGYPLISWMGYLCPDLGWGTPCPDLRWGNPHPDLEWGTPSIQTWDGVTPSCLDLGWSTPLPPIWTWDGVPRPHNGGQSESITFRHPSDAGGKD